jgi:hypothetical protein
LEAPKEEVLYSSTIAYQRGFFPFVPQREERGIGAKGNPQGVGTKKGK